MPSGIGINEPVGTSHQGIGSRLPICHGRVRPVPEALRPGLLACSRRADPTLTRGELAALFVVSTKTINRWEARHGISAERTNARVLRYPLECIVNLVALGRELDAERAEHLGLNVRAILSLASSVAVQSAVTPNPSTVQPVVFVAEDDDDCRLLKAWRNSDIGPVLHKIVRALTEQPVITIS